MLGARPGRAPLKNQFELGQMGGKPPFVKLEWIFAGGAAGARAGAAGIWGYIPPKWPETGGRRPGLPGKVKITPNRIKTNSFKGIRGRIVQGKRVEIDPWRPLDRGVYTLHQGVGYTSVGPNLQARPRSFYKTEG